MRDLSPPDSVEHRAITDFPTLAAAVDRWRAHDAVALDTEFVRERTFYPGLGLVQVAVDDGEGGDPEISLVDPLAIEDLSPLAELLDDPSVTKVLHSASEDLEVFDRRLGTVPRPFFDTQIAAGFAGHRASMGLANLVEAILGIDLPKGETRSNWLRRPLRDAQLHYAALDVAYLLPIHRHLHRELERLGRLEWALEDSAESVAPERFVTGEWLHPDLFAKLGRGARPPFDRRGLGVLRELVEWREREARERDLPRGFVVADSDLLALARAAPTSRAEVKKSRRVDVRKVSRHADALADTVSRALALDESEFPDTFATPIDLAKHKKLVDRLRRRVRSIADELDVAPELLATRRTVERLARRHLGGEEPLLPTELRGWRAEVVGAPLVRVLEATLPEAPP